MAPAAHPAYESVDYHYFDFADPSTHRIDLGSMPNGQYRGVTFLLGVPGSLNQAGTQPSESPHDDMRWPEVKGGAYVFMRWTGMLQTTQGSEPYTIETGQLVLDGTLHSDAVPYDCDPQDSPGEFGIFPNTEWEFHLTMDLNRWLDDSHVYDITAHPQPVACDPVAQSALWDNGLGAFELRIVQVR